MELLKPRAFTLALAVACAGPVLLDQPISAQTGTTFLAIADRTNEHVSIASDSQFVAITWAASKAGGGTDIYVATSRDQGQSFSAPVRANAIDGQANVNGEQPPQVVIARAAGPRTITVIWTAKVRNGTRVLTARSSDEGRTFAAAVPGHGTDGVGNRGWLARGMPDRSGIVAFRPLDIGGQSDGRYPAIATTPTHVIVAWTMRRSDATRIAVARVPLS
jgi:hypothetical protein